MARMVAAEATVRNMESDGELACFGIPGHAIVPLAGVPAEGAVPTT